MAGRQRNKNNNGNSTRRRSNTLFGGLTGRAESALRNRGNRVDRAVERATGSSSNRTNRQQRGRNNSGRRNRNGG